MSGLPSVRRRQRLRRTVILSFAAMVAAAFIVGLVVRYAASNPEDVNLGRKDFRVGNAKRLAARIKDQAEPLLFKDPLTSRVGREIYVHHLGDDSKAGWTAFDAYAPDASREIRCILKWDRAQQRFDDPCSDATFPADGDGLRAYKAHVESNGQLVVDLRDSDST